VPGHMSEPMSGESGAGDGVEEVRRAQVRRLRPQSSRTSGRERHDEKITVYVAPEELFALEQARLVLRAEHGIAIDRGRLVREAVAEMLIDLEAHGEDSVVVRRLRAQ
jgi:hypothetical protein